MGEDATRVSDVLEALNASVELRRFEHDGSIFTGADLDYGESAYQVIKSITGAESAKQIYIFYRRKDHDNSIKLWPTEKESPLNHVHRGFPKHLQNV